jgi:hypothetical protein
MQSSVGRPPTVNDVDRTYIVSNELVQVTQRPPTYAYLPEC